MQKDKYKLLETKSLFKGEQFKGLLTSLTSATIANILNYILSTSLKFSIQSSTFISLYIVGNILAYIFDILFAKEYFWNYKLNKNVYIPFSAFALKSKWLLNSFIDKYFMKFFVTAIIDSIIGITLLKYTIKQLDNYKIMTTYKYRNLIVAALIAGFTFVLYLNPLRFNWAYNNQENPVLNMLVIIWLTLSILIIVKFDELIVKKE